MKKSQISMEFMIIISLVFLVFIGFLTITYGQFSNLNEEKDYSSMYNLANLIKNEVLIASKVHNNYIRKFDIPYRLNGNDYTVELDADVLSITNENDLTVTIVLPVETRGGFTQKIVKGQLLHCITKNKFDGVRISKNQATIESADDKLKDTDDDGILEINAYEEFYVFVRMNCLDNIQTVGFSLELTNLEHIGSTILYQYDDFGVMQEYINPFFWKEPNQDIVLEKWEKPFLTFSIPQKAGQASSGSGNVVKLRLKAGSGKAEIKFVPNTITLMDDTATYLTKEALPSSDIPMKIDII